MYRLLFNICLITFVLTSCEGNTDVEIYLSNQSSDTITVKLYNDIDSSIYDVLPNSNTEIYTQSMLGGQSDPGKISYYIDSLSLERHGIPCKVNLLINPSWEIITEHTRKVPSNYTHRFVRAIKSDDF